MNETPKTGLGPAFRNLMHKPNAAVDWVWRRLAAFSRATTLRARVVLLVVALFVVGIWGLALSITLALERDLTKLLSASISAETNNLAADLDRDIRLYVEVLTRLAESLTPEMLADPARLNRALDHFSDSSAIVPAACFVANRNGIITAGYPEHSVQVGATIKDSRYFGQVIATGAPVIGEPILAGPARLPSALPIAVPVHGAGGATIGVLVATVLHSDPLLFGQTEHARIGQTGWILVISPKDRMIIAATDRRRIGSFLPGHGVIPLLDRRLEEGYEGPGVTRASIGPEVMTVTRKMATTGWVVNAAVPTAEIFEPIVSLKRRIYLAALLISLAMVLILRHFLGRQFAPLAQAGSAMRRMTDGETPMTTIPVIRPDEIGDLIASFNRLVAERARLEQSLQAEIVERKQAHDALRESTNRIEGIYQSVGDGIITMDAQQRIVLFNAAAERIFGYTAAEMIGQPLSVLLPERFRSQHEENVRGFGASDQGSRVMGAYRLISGLRSGGVEFPVEASVSQSGDSPGKLFTVILRDITERKQAEQMREQLVRRLEQLSERLTTAQEEERRHIAHELHEELGQELTTLKLYLQMIAPGSAATEAGTPREQAIAAAVHALERIRKLVLDLEPPELAAFGLYAAVRTYCQQQLIEGGWNLHLDAPKPDARAPRNVERACFRVLQEALSNVLHHAKASEVWVTVLQGNDELELTVRDNGTGFFRNGGIDDSPHERGGLGLFGMQIRAKPAGGSVEINSTPGAGTVVRAVFPLHRAAAAAEDTAQADSQTA